MELWRSAIFLLSSIRYSGMTETDPDNRNRCWDLTKLTSSSVSRIHYSRVLPPHSKKYTFTDLAHLHSPLVVEPLSPPSVSLHSFPSLPLSSNRVCLSKYVQNNHKSTVNCKHASGIFFKTWEPNRIVFCFVLVFPFNTVESPLAVRGSLASTPPPSPSGFMTP